LEIRRTVSKNHCPQYLKLSKLKLPFGDTSKDFITSCTSNALVWNAWTWRSLFAK
jgi:hypothetical protein